MGLLVGVIGTELSTSYIGVLESGENGVMSLGTSDTGGFWMIRCGGDVEEGVAGGGESLLFEEESSSSDKPGGTAGCVCIGDAGLGGVKLDMDSAPEERRPREERLMSAAW